MKKLILSPILVLFLILTFSFYATPSFAEEDQAKNDSQQEEASKDKDDEKVDSVWDAFKYTGRKIEQGGKTAGSNIKKGSITAGRGIKKGGKAAGRGFKKAGSSIKGFFAGD